MLTFEERVLCGNPLQRFGSGLEPDPEPTREFGPVANTSCKQFLRIRFPHTWLAENRNYELERLRLRHNIANSI